MEDDVIRLNVALFLRLMELAREAVENDVARNLPCDVEVFNKSISKYDVFVILRVCVILEQSVSKAIVPLSTFCFNKVKSKSKINLLYPTGFASPPFP